MGLIALAFSMAMPMSARVAPLPGGEARLVRLGPIGEALKIQLAGADPALAAFYQARNYRPIWIQGWGLRPDAQAVVQALASARDDGLDPQSYGAGGLAEVLAAAASSHAPADLARAEAALSRAASGYLADLHAPKPGAEMVYADPAVAAPRPSRAQVLDALARARSPGDGIARLRRMNPVYQQLRAAYAAARRSNAAEAEARILVNLERARGLPPDPGPRYILVDAAAQMLWLYQDGRPVDSMPVVVGKVSEPTPMMAGVVRYAVVRPYWNVPPDLVQHTVAPRVLRQGLSYLDAQDMELLSGWTDDAQVLSPDAVDWAAVASGRQVVRVRQRPGPHNMMGQVKFVFPNSLGVYLHDSPLRQYFAESRRTESSGCVRLSDAKRVARWLLADQAAQLNAAGEPETRVDLAQPIPVFIVYFTVEPGPGGLTYRADIYHRDAPLEARLSSRASRA